ncbi:LysR family glycine cleavage system transcriptional activator [Rhodoblastus acidophilus]|uniref:LysR family transcriptional regulator n=1 Tax=Rhodoblastus acidophilus TaxID=1074 RepID=UPI0022246C10|nr:LysR family transcriptional regulator [Rhodoblastus acidophilus]MCW2316690.1 LysR family glycine cleavage system transcriptional activator [Rhodoblastus acidophilus]
MRRKIPNLGALMAFESAARHDSFTKAAEELGLTQGAVCRRIAQLEDHLGVPLFVRLPRGVKLSEAGESYSRRIALRLDEIERDTLALMSQPSRGVTLELAVMPTFATRWLLPRLARFYAKNPDISLNLSTQTRPFLFDGSGFDAALYFGLAGWPGTQAHLLMHEDSYPVCCPSLLKRRKSLTPEQIAELPLIQQATRPYAWRDWFSARGLLVPRDMMGMRMELFSMSAQAAMLGTGVALIPAMLIEEELREGRLAIANAHAHRDDKAYHLIVPEHSAASEPLARLRDWLLEEARAEAPRGPNSYALRK